MFKQYRHRVSVEEDKMKTCPNCGSKMGSNVNFCTNCGADIRNVPLDSEVQATAPAAQPTQPAPDTEPTMEQVTTPSRNSQRMTNNVNPQPQPQPQQQVQPQQSVDTAAIKANAANMWQWFVNSWKHPFEEQVAESWYGWVILLVENILVVLGLYICINKYAQNQLGDSEMGQAAQSLISNFSTSSLFELFLYLILVIVAMIAAAYYAHKFVYGSTEPLFTFVNRIVSCSNISAILYVISFVCLIIGSEDMLKMGLPLVGIAMTIFSLATYTVVVGDSAPAVNDKFYGLLIVVVVQFLVMYILGKVFGTAIYNQIQNLIHSSFSGMY